MVDLSVLIRDRTINDVDRAKEMRKRIMQEGFDSLTLAEKNEWLAGMKGAYNYVDLNRVGSVVDDVAAELYQYADNIETYRADHSISADPLVDMPYTTDDVVVSTKTDWAVTDIPTKAQMITYLNNIRRIYNLMPGVSTRPAPDSMSALTYQGANDIEQILYDITLAAADTYAERMETVQLAGLDMFYSGDAYTGEVLS